MNKRLANTQKPGAGPALLKTPPARRLNLTIRGTILAARLEGPQHAEPVVVLLNDTADTLHAWDLVMPRLVTTHRVLRLDWRGHGLSAPADGGYTVAEFSADLAAVLDHLDICSPLLVGHGLGATVALHTAARRPGTRAVLAVDGGLVAQGRHARTWEAAWPSLRRPRRRLPAAALRIWATRSPLAATSHPEAVYTIARARYSPTATDTLDLRLPLAAEHSLALSQWTWNRSEVLPHVDCPVSLLLARSTPDEAPHRLASLQRARELLPGDLDVQLVDGEHDLPLHRPETIATLITRLARRPRGDEPGAVGEYLWETYRTALAGLAVHIYADSPDPGGWARNTFITWWRCACGSKSRVRLRLPETRVRAVAHTRRCSAQPAEEDDQPALTEAVQR
jgi:pimeloyl-ACP methyl ester carboxylesterase